ncbi:MAG: hypothetical protein J6A61_05955 [Clostridia bacterium]|nr:hypothetical protein [Clostridia bacterium]
MTDNDIMTFEKAMFILRHGSCEGERKYLEAVLVIEEEVNRQKAEIERLKEENKKQKLVLENINDTIHPLPFVTDFDVAMSQAKSEAIKEFTSRIEGVLSLHPAQAKYYYEIKKEYIKENQNETNGRCINLS